MATVPAEITDADRALAGSLLNPWGLPATVTRAVAQALADERERARAPFLALADELDAQADTRLARGRTGPVGVSDRHLAGAKSLAAERIRRAAQEPTP